MLRVIEVNDNDIFGKVFNGYDIMEQLNKDENFKVKQLVLNKYSNNKNVERFILNEEIFFKELYLHNLEHDILSVHSLLSISNESLKNKNAFKKADIVHYHQVHNCHFSLDNFFDMSISKPTVMSLHDPWFITGRCVHPNECTKWKNGCKNCTKLNTFFDLPEDNCSELWNIKKRISETDIDLVVNSKFMYDLVKESSYLKDLRVHLVNFGVDINKYTYELSKEEAKKKLNIFPEDFVIFFRENKAFKGTEYALDALKKLDVAQNITLLTCSEKGLLKGLEDKYNIVELGVISESEVRECYNAADLFLMPSPAESFGMMAVEGMASGVPTIVFDNTALPSTTGAPDYGILVKNLDSDDLCKKIKYYIENPEELRHRSEISRQFVIDNYNYDNYFNKLKDVYQEAYEKQKYKLSKNQKRDTNVDYQDQNSQRVLKKLYELSELLFTDKQCYPSILSNYEKSDDKKIEYSNPNVLSIIDKFNKEVYSLFLNRKVRVSEYYKKSDSQNLPKVSIIIPVYNGENYVSLAIESALRQTYKNLEIIVVNDGSTDKTDKICRSYGNKIKYIKKENGGVSTALNVGIENMTGDYFSWLSHDDLYYPNKVEVEVNYLIENGLLGTDTILYSNFSIIDEFGNYNYDVEYNSRYLNKSSAIPMLLGSIDGLTLLIPKRAFDEYGYFDKDLRCVQDYQLWYKFYKNGYKFVHVPEITVSTRVHAKQVTNTSPRVVTEGNKYWVDLLKDFSKEEKEELFGSEFNYWYILSTLFDGGPYNEAFELCKNEYSKIMNKHKKDNSKVSVIVNLNGSLSSDLRSIKSLLNQTYKNVEYIIYYNGEVNNIDIIKKLGKENYKIMETKENNASIWNDGLKKATGKYITFLDSNSYYSNEKIEKQVELMQNSESPISYTSYYKNKKNINELIDIGFNNWQIDALSKEVFDINLSTVMIDKEAILNNKISFNEDYPCGEDIVFIMDVLKLRYPIGIRKPLVEVSEITNMNNNKRIYNAIKHLMEEYELTIDDSVFNELIASINDNKKESELKKQRLYDIRRYRYYLTDEFKNVNKIRNIKNRLLHGENYPTYNKPLETLSTGKLVSLYRINKKIFKKIRIIKR